MEINPKLNKSGRLPGVLVSYTTNLSMHGSHFHSPESEISNSRLGPPIKSCESFGFKRCKGKSESSPTAKAHKWFLGRILGTAVLTVLLMVVGFFRTFGPSSMIKIYAATNLIVAYLAPKLMIAKRGLTSGEWILTNSKIPPIIEILPIPLHLIIALGSIEGSDLAKIGNFTNTLSQVIAQNRSNLMNNTNVFLNSNATTVFESLVFGLCHSNLKNHRNPTKITVIGSSKAAPCVLGKYRWALKIPRELISFQINSNSSTSQVCPSIKRDPFDCKNIGREHVRKWYSEKCPELAPFLKACNNREDLGRALSHQPSWATKNVQK